MDYNILVLSGRLATEPEFRTFASGSSLMRFLVTTRRTEPRRRVDVIPVTLWEPPEELVAAPPRVGDGMWLAGAVRRRFWSPDGVTRSRVEVVAHHVEVRPTESGTGGGAATEPVAGQ